MNVHADHDSPETCYSLEVAAEITGLSTTSILHYQESGLVHCVRPSASDVPGFDDEALRTLRRIEHLTSACEMNVAGLRLLLALTEEVERLRDQIRTRR